MRYTWTLGHKKLSMTMERYTHTSPEMQTAAAETISRQLFPRTSESSGMTTSQDKDVKMR